MYPSTFSAFNRPNPSDKLNSPSHSDLHNTVSSAVGQLETVVGLTTSSSLGSLMYDVRSPDSDGGGHIQTAVKGGTGQTTYMKGDILVAQNPSVLTKLAVGTNGQRLVADSGTSIGVRWGTGGGTRVSNSASVITIASITSETSFLSATVAGSTLGTNGAVRATLYVSGLQTRGDPAQTFTVRAHYGNASIATLTLGSIVAAGNPSMVGKIEYNLIGNQNVNAQRGILLANLGTRAPIGSTLALMSFGAGTQDSGANQTFGITIQPNVADNQLTLTTQGYIAEAIN